MIMDYALTDEEHEFYEDDILSQPGMNIDSEENNDDSLDSSE